jgi:hypothetical protein
MGLAVTVYSGLASQEQRSLTGRIRILHRNRFWGVHRRSFSNNLLPLEEVRVRASVWQPQALAVPVQLSSLGASVSEEYKAAVGQKVIEFI